MTVQQLNHELGNVDLYLLDQILKNRIPKEARILDAGCGEGRNLIYLLNNQYNVSGIDLNEDAMKMLHFVLGSKYPSVDKDQFVTGALDKLPYENDSFDYIICSAVLHFAESHEHFWKMISELDRVITSGGQLFIRMTSNIGLKEYEELENGRAHLPDQSIRYLITDEMIEKLVNQYAYEYIEPVKSVLVNHHRSMTTLILQKSR